MVGAKAFDQHMIGFQSAHQRADLRVASRLRQSDAAAGALHSLDDPKPCKFLHDLVQMVA